MVSTSGTATLSTGVSVSGTTIWNGMGATSASGGSSATLSTYSGGNNGGGNGNDVTKEQENRACTTLLPQEWCNETDGKGIMNIIKLVIGIMTMGITALSSIGIIWSAVLIITARDNEAQVVAAKNRIFNIIVGLVAWGLLAVFVNLLLPGSDSSITGLF